LPKSERGLSIEALQALWRERMSAYHIAGCVAIERNAATVDYSAFGIENVAQMLRRFGAAPAPH
jgi:hypothetical protein